MRKEHGGGYGQSERKTHPSHRTRCGEDACEHLTHDNLPDVPIRIEQRFGYIDSGILKIAGCLPRGRYRSHNNKSRTPQTMTLHTVLLMESRISWRSQKYPRFAKTVLISTVCDVTSSPTSPLVIVRSPRHLNIWFLLSNT